MLGCSPTVLGCTRVHPYNHTMYGRTLVRPNANKTTFPIADAPGCIPTLLSVNDLFRLNINKNFQTPK